MKNKSIFFCFVLLAFFFIAGLFFLIFEQSGGQDALSPEIIFEIKSGSGLDQVAQDLKNAGLIKNRLLFSAFAFVSGATSDLKAGSYFLSASMSFSQILKKIRLGDTVRIKITIPEGYNIGQIQELLNERFNDPKLCQKNCTRNFLITAYLASDFKQKFGFLHDVPPQAALEGYLFPDTYIFELDASNEEVIIAMLQNFQNKIGFRLENEAETRGKTVFDIVTMASLIEKEVWKEEDKKRVAGVLWKRLDKEMPLQVDCTLAYITGKRTTKFSIAETKIDSPYNTYRNKGLPLGPICNPGMESISASLNPDSNDYYYYLSTPNGTTIFSKTYQQHIVAKSRYLK